MRFFLIILLLLTTNLVLAQQSGTIKVRKKKSKLLCLNGFTDGAIQPYAVCGGKGLYVTNSEQYRIKSFVLLIETIREIEVKMNGNVISGDVCETIETLKAGDIIYINKIVAVDNTTGADVNMPPMKFEIRANMDDRKQRYNMLNENN